MSFPTLTYWEMCIPYLSHCEWSEKVALWPRKCLATNKSLWLKKAMVGKRVLTGPGEPIIEYHWLSKDAFVFEKLKGNI